MQPYKNSKLNFKESKMQLPAEQSKAHILVADDDAVIRHLVCSIVKTEGYESVSAVDWRCSTQNSSSQHKLQRHDCGK